MKRKSLKLSLIENSHNFLVEAVKKAIEARTDVHQWKFSILNLVQALELTLKEVLRREHPIFIYENIDLPKNTITISQALSRIENDKILGIFISKSEKKKIKKAIELRNKITHFELDITEEYAMVKFSELFAFLIFFQARFLKIEIDEILKQDYIDATLEIERCYKELKRKAYQRIEEEGFTEDLIWLCPNCGEETFVIDDSQNVCFLCRYYDEIVECPQCSNLCFAFEVESFSDLIDTEYEEGVSTILNDYGYSKFTACSGCMGKIRENIENQKEEEYYQYLAEEEWHMRNRNR